MNISEEKDLVRIAIRKHINEFYRGTKASQQETTSATEHLLHSPLYSDATLILAYAATQEELSLDRLIRHAMAQGKMVALPRCSPHYNIMHFHLLSHSNPFERQVLTGHYGIREPQPNLPMITPQCLDSTTLLLVPAIAFTPQGLRLGKGKGYYDRYLKEIIDSRRPAPSKRPPLFIGVAYSCQIVDRLPTQPWDIPMDYLLTKAGLHHCKMKET